MTEVDQVDLVSNLPEWMGEDPTIIALSFAMDRQYKEVIEAIPECIIIPVIQELTNSDLIDHLAYQFHVDFYDPTDTIERRRELVHNSIVWHRKKGTLGLVQEVLDYWYPGGATVEEWFHYKIPFPPNYPDVSDPNNNWHHRYVFRILVDQAVISSADEARALEIIDRYKPISRWPEAVLRARVGPADIYWAGGTAVWHYTTSEAAINFP